MAMSNEDNIAMLFPVHVAPVDLTDLRNEVVNAFGDLLRGPAKQYERRRPL